MLFSVCVQNLKSSSLFLSNMQSFENIKGHVRTRTWSTYVYLRVTYHTVEQANKEYHVLL